MDDKHIVFESTVVGLLFFFMSWITFCSLNPDPAIFAALWILLPLFGESIGASEAIARLVVVGVILSTVGVILRVISIGWHQKQHGKDDFRKTTAEEIRNAVTACRNKECERHPLPCLPDTLVNRIRYWDFDDPAYIDPLFVWVQYSDPRPELREWGRTRRRYMYVGENWSTAISLGFVMGTFLGCLSWLVVVPPVGLPFLLYFPLWMVALLVMLALERLIEHNRNAEETMVATYVAGILCENLKEIFLKPLKAFNRDTNR